MSFDECNNLECVMQAVNVGGIKFGNTLLILPTTKLNSTPIFAAIYSDKSISRKIYKLHSYIAM